MNFNKKSILKTALIFTAALLIGTIPSNAQAVGGNNRPLPAAHERQHQQMIHNHSALAVNTNTATPARPTAAELASREDRDRIYSQYWTNQHVNPYGNIDVPATADINVSQGVVPVPGAVTSNYGWRAQFGRMHRGVDLALRTGDTVRVAFSGKVRVVSNEPGGYGNYVVVRHDNGLETVYGHLSKHSVKPNQRVEAGDPIGLGGSTGRSTGPHLHFETRYLGLAINPALIFDFDHNTTHRDVFTFDKAAYQKAQVSGSRTRKPSTTTASKVTKAKKKSTSTRRRSRK